MSEPQPEYESAGELVAQGESLPTTAVTGNVVSPMTLVQMAIEKNLDTDKLEKLMDLAERHEKNEAKRKFDHAMSGFRGEAVQIIKRRKASFAHKSGGGRTEYDFADLSDAVEAAVSAMSKWGLSHHWETDFPDADNKVVVTCILTHEAGHSISTSFPGRPDTTGSKNPIQAMASTVSYLEKYTFLAITGLAAKGMDDDGGGGGIPPTEKISDEQVDKLAKLIKDTDSDLDKFLEYAHVEKLEDIEVRNYEILLLRLKEKAAIQAQAE